MREEAQEVRETIDLRTGAERGVKVGARCRKEGDRGEGGSARGERGRLNLSKKGKAFDRGAVRCDFKRRGVSGGGGRQQRRYIVFKTRQKEARKSSKSRARGDESAANPNLETARECNNSRA